MQLTVPSIRAILSIAFGDNNSLDSARHYLVHGKWIGNSELIRATREVILDPTQTWSEKAEEWIGMNVRPEEENEKFWRTIWDTISEGQPWPFDEVKK